jgi:hypothetical protein
MTAEMVDLFFFGFLSGVLWYMLGFGLVSTLDRLSAFGSSRDIDILELAIVVSFWPIVALYIVTELARGRKLRGGGSDEAV